MRVTMFMVDGQGYRAKVLPIEKRVTGETFYVLRIENGKDDITLHASNPAEFLTIARAINTQDTINPS